ncbi:MAG: Methyltransferase type 11 [Candidatus Daviesbacteria bacterium GW2011_GWA1_41_61]|uniref:Methyltransferase type 11 n=1 Tax=Candidatus Daviesbacteria bacterium GW2011_GWA2_40_9 TaxID=1618424 RepID=A0A0G0U578_9BACT|nr:MAG: methyltransferase type 11 [Candidatus Daviesbacteria bacterium GW2011_GWC1_40_9]KKR82336.1 MAG: Methyltransferase type 11 [Candidatus Daviesbacteria bacterium GW2011_GWA2_40_9]KKR92989.1 MAG: Methyltransferase type 11 [Candidatus Daviesbacteria bacterium GW2011_GWB1_41_15]KKS15533.1 MAG: Methyltransferase type 11 [Candidatus Daviesbacteria bacterium GW2011_GWA1_41_61]
MKTLEKFWEQRSQKYGTRIEGVLLKSVPSVINDYLHQWMLEQISSEVENKESVQVLDIGCGYGRLSGELLNRFSKIKIVGVDIAPKYVDLYNQQLAPRGRAFKGDVRQLPFKDNSFNMIFMVTTLMYLSDDQDQKKAMKEITRVLKPGGRLMIIERNPLGYNIFNLGGLISKLRGQKHSEIPAVSFSPSRIFQLAHSFDLKVVKRQGLPGFTVFFFPILASALVNNHLARLFLRLIKKIDSQAGWFVQPSLYISYSGIKA